MSEAAVAARLPVAAEPLRVAIRRMRWFFAAFRDQLAAVSTETGVAFEVDERKLGAAFVRWLRAVEAQKPADRARRRDYFDFAAGLMLRELMRDMPLRATRPAGGADPARAEHFWPEGFACTVFCVNVRAAVLAQEFDETSQVAPQFFDIRHWWSFRENVREDGASAIGFFDLFVGRDPDWRMPEAFHARLIAAED